MPTGTQDVARQPQSTRQHRFHALDAMRGVAAVLVVIYHLPIPLHKIVPNGYLVVDLFFVLSGFVIGYSYEDRLRTNMSVQTFTLARIVRLYPLYLVGTLLGLLNIGLHALHMHDRSLLTFLPVLLAAVLFLPNLFARGLSPQFYPLDGPAWSLFFEIVANIVFAAMVRRRLAPSAVMLVLALVFLAVLALTPQSSNSGWSFETFWPALARVGYSFFAGVLLCRMFRKGARATLSGRPAWFTMFAVCSVICFCIAIPLSVPQARVFSLMVTAVVFPGLVLLGAGCEVTSPWQPLCNFLGDTSYPLYAIHSPTFYFIALVQHFHRPELTWAFSLTLLVLLIPLSWWLGKYFDLPTRRFLTTYLQQRTA